MEPPVSDNNLISNGLCRLVPAQFAISFIKIKIFNNVLYFRPRVHLNWVVGREKGYKKWLDKVLWIVPKLFHSSGQWTNHNNYNEFEKQKRENEYRRNTIYCYISKYCRGSRWLSKIIIAVSKNNFLNSFIKLTFKGIRIIQMFIKINGSNSRY